MPFLKPIFVFLAAVAALFLLSCQPGKKLQGSDRFSDQKTRIQAASPDGPDWYLSGAVKMEDLEYQPNIRTVRIHKQNIELSMPVLELGSSDRLVLSFDDLDGSYKEYRYKIVHCDAFWNPSNMLVTEYLEGFSEGLVTEYAFALATRQPYVHYRAKLPADEMKITRSGNYVVLVYLASNPESVVLSRRFMVFESAVKVNARARKSSVVENQRYQQEIDFDIEKGMLQIDNPFTDLIVVLQQNGRWDNAILDLKPRLVLGDKLSYDWDRINVFDGMNEYRHIDIRSLSRYSPRIGIIERDSLFHHVYVKPDYKRGFQVYIEDKDLNGEYIIQNDDAISNHHIEADYAWVHFTFPYQSPFDQGAIYIFGALTNWQFSNEFRMEYNPERKTYEVSLYLKQGYYNYHYVMLDNAGLVGGTFLTEGDHSETENFYTIYVYFRKPGNNYDQLIAIERITAPQPR